MDSYDLSDFYEKGGLFVKNAVDVFLKDKQKLHNDDTHKSHCVEYLLSVSDDKFKHIYYNMPVSYAEYTCNTLNGSESEDEDFALFDYAYAFASDYELIQRCISFSPVPLNISIDILTKNECLDDMCYKNFSLKSCKLLHENGCNLSNLLNIALTSNNIDVLLYVTSSISNVMLAELLLERDIIYLNIYGFIIIDAICQRNDNTLNYMIYNTLLKHTEHVSHMKISALLQSYYIIKYLTPDEGRKYMTIQNDKYESHLKYNPSTENKVDIQKNVSFHNDLLKYYLTGVHADTCISPQKPDYIVF
jgi:hypothetical protein